jgi:hypothetical protein
VRIFPISHPFARNRSKAATALALLRRLQHKNGQGPPYVHFEDDPGRRTAADLLTNDEARRIAANFA